MTLMASAASACNYTYDAAGQITLETQSIAGHPLGVRRGTRGTRDRLIIRQSNLDAERQRDRLERKARVFQDTLWWVPGVRAG